MTPIAYTRRTSKGCLQLLVSDGDREIGWVDLATGAESVRDPYGLDDLRTALVGYLRAMAEDSWCDQPLPDEDDPTR